jgi:hypothetical protein
MSPHPRAGLDFESIRWCDKIIEKYPDIKINLFVPAAYARLGEEPVVLSLCRDWLDKVGRLPARNYRINYHGFNHRRISKEYGNSNNDEWQYLTRSQTKSLFNKMIEMLAWSRLPVFDTFRPPGWKISQEAAQFLTEKGFLIAGSEEYYSKLKDKIRGLKWISYNWDMTGPCEVKGNIVAVGHTSDWTNNYMNEERYNLVVDLLDGEEFDFRFIEEVQ